MIDFSMKSYCACAYFYALCYINVFFCKIINSMKFCITIRCDNSFSTLETWRFLWNTKDIQSALLKINLFL